MHRKAMHPSHFRGGTPDLFLDLLEQYSQLRDIFQPMVIPCLHVLITWLRICSDETLNFLTPGSSQLPYKHYYQKQEIDPHKCRSTNNYSNPFTYYDIDFKRRGTCTKYY